MRPPGSCLVPHFQTLYLYEMASTIKNRLSLKKNKKTNWLFRWFSFLKGFYVEPFLKSETFLIGHLRNPPEGLTEDGKLFII